MSHIIKKESSQIVIWNQAEKLFIKSPHYSALYAKFFYKKRWKEAEDIIKMDESEWNDYKKHFNIIE